MSSAARSPAPAPSSSSSSRRRRAPIRRWFATAMDRLRLRRRSRSPTALVVSSFGGAGALEVEPPPPPPPPRNQVALPPVRPPPPPPDALGRAPVARPRAVPLSELAAGRQLVSWLAPSQRACALCQKPYEGARTALEARTPWEEREQAVRVPGCARRPDAHVIGRRCLERWRGIGGGGAPCPLCAWDGADAD
ncbi:hypothetical protein GTA08_BOTSDO08498 [Neofusicoccum parvum]|uniref:Uncharacterized protein n=1 Tax=Neofusicoccum parvum TaxID=310453 RepID=A0ACB5SB54_9PEZI|nr:hypothetical protein GTA08_BOTSDO08498 [Neofusicoccum parvum]